MLLGCYLRRQRPRPASTPQVLPPLKHQLSLKLSSIQAPQLGLRHCMPLLELLVMQMSQPPSRLQSTRSIADILHHAQFIGCFTSEWFSHMLFV